MRIHVVCGAGASSTFVALRLRRTLAARGMGGTVTAGSVQDVPDRLGAVDVVLVGPHLGDVVADIRYRADDRGVPVALLPDTVFAARDGDTALDLAIATVAAYRTHPDIPVPPITTRTTTTPTTSVTTREVPK